MKTWIGVLTVAVVFLGIGYLNLYCSGMKFDSGSAGVIVSALGVLVTALVGWQIYKSIEINSMLKNISKLEKEFIKSNNALAVQDIRNIELIEAFECKHQADKYDVGTSISHLTIRYYSLLLAVKHFINANMQYDYNPFRDAVNKLSEVLIHIENINPNERSQFNNRMDEYETIYDDIITAIDIRIEELRELKHIIKSNHDRRHRIHNMSANTNQP